MIELVDTNVILRYLVGDNKNQKEEAKRWFKEAKDDKRKLVIKPLVIAEACFVLESFYKKNREEIANVFEVFLSQRWLGVDDREAMLSLWFWYRQKLHFVDSYLLALAKSNHSKLLSFDKKLLKFE